MTVVELLARVEALDVRLTVDGERLRVSAPSGVLTPELQRELSARKPELIALLRGLQTRDVPIAHVPRSGTLPISFVQERLWFLDQMAPGQPTYTMVDAFRVPAFWAAEGLRQVCAELTRRHETLRTVFVEYDGQPSPRIAETGDIPVVEIDLTGTAPEAREAAWTDAAERAAREPFDLSRLPLIRATLVRVSPVDLRLVLVVHHIIADEWSLAILRREVVALYDAIAQGQPSPLPPLVAQYVDYAAWQRTRMGGEGARGHVDFWRQALGDAPTTLELPADRPRPAVQSFRGRTETRTVAGPVLTGLRAVGQQEHATPFETVMAGFLVLMSRYAGQSDVLVGTPISGRSRLETEAIVGMFVNTIVLRGTVAEATTFRDMIRHVRDWMRRAHEHADLPFDRLVAELAPVRDLSRSPLVQVMATYLTEAAPTPVDAVSSLPVPDTHTSRFDLTMFLTETADGLRATAEYNTDLFNDATISRLLRHFEHLLEALTTHPDTPVLDIPLLGDEERRKVLVEWNSPVEARPSRSLVDLLERAASLESQRPAVTDDRQRLTYEELHRRANQLAHHLRRHGAGPNMLVGVFVERSVDLVVAILGILKTGAAYVPLDPIYPAERLAAILDDARAATVVTESALSARLPSSVELVQIDVERDEIARESVEAPTPAGTPDDIAYVLFTSGSTGRPKGVAIPHRAAVAFIDWARSVFSRDDLAGVLFSTSVCFDLSVFEIFVTLSSGGTVVVVPSALHLPAMTGSDRVTLINTVPSIMAELLRMKSVPPSVRVVNLAGEALPSKLVDAIAHETRAERIYNLYGPTETTTYSTWTRVRPGERVTIGRPITQTQVYILDPRGQPQPIGVPGEVFIAGAGLALGYYNQPALTAERFVPDPFVPGARMYRTGDSARWLADGTIEYLGRLDHQVKVRGLRIELGEIESVLGQHPSVNRCVVVDRERPGGDRVLVGYVEPHGGAAFEVAHVRTFLGRKLPEYMVPSVFVTLDRLPLNQNGKVDRKALPALAPGSEVGATAEAREPAGATEQALAAIWTELLDVPAVRATDSFFALGGHSLLAMRMLHRLKQDLDVQLPPGALFTYPVLADLAAHIEHVRSDRGASPQQVLVQIEQGGSGTPFFWVHGIGGEVFSYLTLSRHLGRSRPIYGFAADWTQMEGETEPTLERIAAYYVRELRKVKPDGPYHLGGFCAAAMLALEMAQQLTAGGAEVGVLAAIDYNDVPSTPSFPEALMAFSRNFVRWLRDDAMRSGVGDLVGRMRSRLQRIGARTSLPGSGGPARESDLRDELGMWRFPDEQLPMLRAHHRALRQYRPKPLRGKVLLCLPRTAPLFGPWPTGYDPSWDSIAQEGVIVRSVRGSHSSMLNDPFAEQLAAVLDAAIRKSESDRHGTERRAS